MNDEKKTQELVELGQKILAWKNERGWSHNQMTKQFKGLGSERSLKRISEGNPTGDIDRWLSHYRAVWEAIKRVEGATIKVKNILPLGNIEPGRCEVMSALLAAESNPGMINRLIVIEGGSGSGKSSTLESLANDLAGSAVYIEADDTWRSAHAAAGDILEALGAKRDTEEIPANKNARVRKLISRLQPKTVLLIDEAQHGAGTFLSLIKTILNRTPSVIVLAAIPTLWRKLTQTYSEESLQLQQNRLYSRVQIPAVTEKDVKAYLADCVELDDEEAIKLKNASYRRGHFSFLRRVKDVFIDPNNTEDEMSIDDVINKAIYQMIG